MTCPQPFERLGIFTIIVFGELTLGVINGIIEVHPLTIATWINFVLALSLVFGLWWIFFTMIARREAKKNFARASLLELSYIPALVALGFLAAGFPSFFSADDNATVQHLFGYGITIFLTFVSLMIGLLEFPSEFNEIIKPMRISIFITGLVFLLLSFIKLQLTAVGYLITAVVLLNIEIVYLNFVYNRQLDRRGMKPTDEQA